MCVGLSYCNRKKMAKSFDLIDVCPSNTKPGTLTRLYRVKASWVNTWPKTVHEAQQAQPSPTIVAGDRVRLDGDIVLDDSVEGEGYFQQFDIRVDSGKPLFQMVGEQGAYAFISNLEFQIVGFGPQQVEFALDTSKPCWIYLVELKNGEAVCIGRPGIPAYAETIEGDGGFKAGDFAGTTYRLVADTEPMFYNGVIDLTPNPAS